MDMKTESVSDALPGPVLSGRTRLLDSKYHEKALQEIMKRNKKCADCLKPSPTFVNLSIGTFVCLECSGLLREFDFRTKGVGLSTFTPREVQMLDLGGGNKRANEVYMGKHPDGERGSPGWDNIELLKRFLIKKYKDKQWYDESAARKSAEPVRSRADSSSSVGLESPTPSTGRKRVGSKDGVIRGANAVMTGGESHRSFLAATHARAAAQHTNSAHASPMHSDDEIKEDEEEEDDSSEGEGLDATEREKRKKVELRRKLAAFYKIHNPEKLESIDLFVEWVLYHGMAAFNKKLREKYGTDIPSERKKDLQTKRDQAKARERRRQIEKRPLKPEILAQAAQLQALEEAAQAMALQDLASRKRSGSTNPFDDFTAAPLSPLPPHLSYAATANPFDDLMFL